MHLVQILLPLADNEGNAFSDGVLHGIHEELSLRFGGLTAYSRAPAKGVWTQKDGKQEDDIVIVEVMTQTVDEIWWGEFRRRVQKLLDQEQLIIRAQKIVIL
jgi:hypothetical protein